METKTMAQPEKPESWCRGCLGRNLSRRGDKDGYALLLCADCGTTVVDPYPTEEQLRAHYSGHAKTGSYLRRVDRKLKRARGRVRLMKRQGVPGDRFLDVGCNIGTVAKAAQEMGFKAYGIDIDAAAVEQAKGLFGDHAAFEAVPLQDVAKRGDKFDALYCSEVIEHVPDPESFAAALGAAAAPGGLLLLTAPDGGHFGVPRNFADWDMVCPPEHITWFSRRGITRLLERHGFKVEGFRWAFKPGLKVFARKI